MKGWDVESGQKVVEYSTPRNIVTAMTIDSPGNILFQGSEDLCIRAWDTRTASKSHPALHITSFVYFPLCMALHADGNLLAAGCKGFDGVGCEVKLFDVRNTKTPLSEFHSHRHDVTGCRFSMNSAGVTRGLISVSKDGSIALWDVGCAQGPSVASVQLPASSGAMPVISQSTTTAHSSKSLAYEVTPGKYYTSMTGYTSTSTGNNGNGTEEVLYIGSFDGCVSRVRIREKKDSPSTQLAFDIDYTSAAYFTDSEGVTATPSDPE